MAKGAVIGAIASHIQKPFLCLGVRLSRSECKCGIGAAQTERGYTRGIYGDEKHARWRDATVSGLKASGGGCGAVRTVGAVCDF